MKASLFLFTVLTSYVFSTCNGEAFDSGFFMFERGTSVSIFGVPKTTKTIPRNSVPEQQEPNNNDVIQVSSSTGTSLSTLRHAINTAERKVLHAVEAAEGAFVNAIRDEVDLLFHDSDHEHLV